MVSDTLVKRLAPIFFDPDCFSNPAIRASNSSFVGSAIGSIPSRLFCFHFLHDNGDGG